MARILVVDDDLSLQTALELFLTEIGHEVFKASNGLQALELTRALNPDLLILDIMMPTMNGLEVCKTIKKESDIPIIILSAKDAAEDRVQGLENGADDYVTKPFNLKELELRITARLRPQNENSKTKRYVFKDLIIDYEQRQVLLKNNSVELTPLEFDLLWFLASHPNRLIEHQELLTKIWGRQEINPNLLHVYMRKLRNKLEISPKNPAHIHNVWEQGYIFKS